ncbi:MAG: hypothetical protein JWQ96_271, partial [Segetibacter sp.]|nr:hypothetical protein [Segetibacter sp.]
FGLKPVSTVSYSIVDRRRQVYNPLHSDSIGTLYEGDGGLYQAYSGIGKRWGGLSLGINAGYSFGRKQTNTRVSILDTVFHYQTNSQTLTSFGDWFVNAGLQYEANVGKNALLRFGVTADLGQKMKASQDISRETFAYNAVGNTNTIDSVFNKNEVEGTIQLPSSYTGGITLNTTVTDQLGRRFDKFMLGVEYQTTNWNDYTFYGQKDNVANSYMVRVGTQIVPDPLSLRNYWSRVSYRAGVYFGKDPVTINGSQLPVAAITLGAGLPIRKFRSYDYQFTVINTAFELGKRGNKDNNITESFFRFSVGLNLSDIWFQKRKYD